MAVIGSVSSIMGFAWPWAPSAGGIPQQTTDADAVKANLEVLYSTEPGEDKNEPTFGLGLLAFVFETTGTLLDTLIESEVERATALWEPRAAIDSVEVDTSTDPRGLTTVEVTVNWIFQGNTYQATASRTSIQ